MSQSTPDPKLADLEKSLASLVPVPGRIDRDQLLFRAGQASVRARPWLWPATTALLTVVASVLGAALALRPAPATIERVVYVQVPQPMTSAPVSSDQLMASASPRPDSPGLDDMGASSACYLQQRNQAIRWGVEALPPAPAMVSAERTPSVEHMLGLPERKEAGLFPLKF